MIKIRYGVFETNSSSVHSLIMCNDDEYKKFMNNELLYDNWYDEFISREEALDRLYENVKNDSEFIENFNLSCGFSRETLNEIPINDLGSSLIDYGILVSDYIFNSNDFEYETYNDTYTTSNSEVVHAFGYYGLDY